MSEVTTTAAMGHATGKFIVIITRLFSAILPNSFVLFWHECLHHWAGVSTLLNFESLCRPSCQRGPTSELVDCTTQTGGPKEN